ncbi:toprim domain-containing protein [Paraburkholderia sp. D1E]|uniref:toprim domain-containing protein n=1 Tax=Paraburkholderia sp. D1E TaxID=3461398 RepID=UPI004045D4E8
MTVLTIDSLAIGAHRIECPGCGRGPKDRTMGLKIWADGSAMFHCFRCEASGGLSPDNRLDQQRVRRPLAPLRADRQSAALESNWRSYWGRLKPPYGTGLAYLTARRCAIPPGDGDLRYCDALRHPSGYTGPALIAQVTDVLTREPISLHHTWVCSDGSKPNITPPRLLLSGHRKKNGVIRLSPDEAVTNGLAVAEGIETALSVAHVFTPVWSCIDKGNLSDFPVLDGIEVLLIISDHDDVGLRAAHVCAQRWIDAGREVRIACSPVSGEDLNDVVRRLRHA